MTTVGKRLGRLGLLLLPLLLAGWWGITGWSFDSAYVVPPRGESFDLPFSPRLADWSLEGVEWLSAARMHEKINGRASFYERFGPEGLLTGAWGNGARSWDMYGFVMHTPEGAHSAYVGERASAAHATDGFEGYVAEGMIALRAGRYYIQLVAAAPDQPLDGGVALASALAGELGTGTGARAPVLPVANQIAQSGGRESEQAFGFSALTDVTHARYRMEGSETVWFKLSGDEPVLDAYMEELKAYGATYVFRDTGVVGGCMFGSWELIGMIDGELWGVRDAASRDDLDRHWAGLRAAVGAE